MKDGKVFERILDSCRDSGGGHYVAGYRFTIEQIIKMYIELQKFFVQKENSKVVKISSQLWWINVSNNRVSPEDKHWMDKNIPFIYEL